MVCFGREFQVFRRIFLLALVPVPVLDALYFYLNSPSVKHSGSEFTLFPRDKTFDSPLTFENIVTASNDLQPILLVQMLYCCQSLFAYLRLTLIDEQ